MMGRGVMFREVVGLVGMAGSPIEMKLFLVDSVLYPVEAHIHGFRFLLAKLLVGKAIYCGIVDSNWGGGLRMSHFSRAIQRVTPSLVLLNRAPHSASSTDEMTLHMIVEVVVLSMALLTTLGLLDALLPRYKCPLRKLCAFALER
jgi:hypothetical protein